MTGSQGMRVSDANGRSWIRAFKAFSETSRNKLSVPFENE